MGKTIKSIAMIAVGALAVVGIPSYLGAESAAATSPGSVVVDYNETTAHAGKYVFGVSSWPRMDPDYAPMLADNGVTMIRQSSIGMGDIVPVTTVTDYLNNVDNVQDPSTWNWNPTGAVETLHEDDVDAFNEAGVDVFSIIAVTPSWLGLTTAYGSMPSNWTVFEDIVKKIYQHYENKIDYFEIFNEPELEIDLTGSSYADDYVAYTDLYTHALDAINSVSPTHRAVGGPAASKTNRFTWLSSMLGNPTYGDDIDFASWHNYGGASTYDAGIYNWKTAATTHGKPDLPLFVSEYNSRDDANSTEGIPWVAGRISVLMDAGATGAFLYGTDDRASGLNASVRHTWHIINQDGSLTPRMWAIRLLSKRLELGAGENEMKLATKNGLTWASGAINANGKAVVWAVNDTESSVTTDFELDNTGLNGPVSLIHYVADASHDAATPYASETKTALDGHITTTVTVPAKSVYGILVDTAATPGVTESIWGGLVTTQTWKNRLAWELGTKFQPSVPGDVSAIKVYSIAAESGNHTARIWNNSTGTVVGGPYTLNYGGTNGWVSFDLPSPVSLVAGTQYTVTVSTGTDSNKWMPYTTVGATTAGNNNGLLSYPANAGVASNTMGALPTFSSGNNYLRDVVFRPAANVNLALGKTATSSTSYGTGFEAAKAVDGIYYANSSSNAWASNATHVGAWWMVDLGSVTSIGSARIQFRGYSNSSAIVFQQVPASITLQVSDDNLTWTTVTSKSTNVPISGTAYSQSLYSYPLNTSGRYLRLLFEDGSQGGTGGVLDELTEVEVYAY